MSQILRVKKSDFDAYQLIVPRDRARTHILNKFRNLVITHPQLWREFVTFCSQSIRFTPSRQSIQIPVKKSGGAEHHERF